MRPPATARERLDWLRLFRTENVGPATFLSLMSRFGTAARALDALPTLSSRAGRMRALRIPDLDEVRAEADALAARGGAFLAQGEAQYPPLLAAIDGAPPLLAVLGQPALLSADILAIVGARNASAAGIRMARLLAAELSQAGFVIVSGLARGIDTAAHEASFSTGTIGVLAGGIDVVYPPENRTLYETMTRQGAIISEMPLGTAPQAQHFPRRNRLISGLARAVIIIEAAERSGSLITARFALEQGREVMAVPGSPLDPRCRGTNRLIRDGATLVQDAADVTEALGTQRKPAPRANGFDEPEPPVSEDLIDSLRPVILSLLGPTPVEIDEIIRQTGAPASAVAAIITELELMGRLTRQAGQLVCLI